MKLNACIILSIGLILAFSSALSAGVSNKIDFEEGWWYPAGFNSLFKSNGVLPSISFSNVINGSYSLRFTPTTSHQSIYGQLNYGADYKSIGFKLRVDNCGNFWFGVTDNAVSEWGHLHVLFSDGTIYANGIFCGIYETGVIYHVQITMDYDNNAYNLHISQNGNAIVNTSDIPFSSPMNAEDIQAFWMIGEQGGLVAIIDDIEYSGIQLTINDMNDLFPDDPNSAAEYMVNTLLGADIPVSNVYYTGATHASGTFEFKGGSPIGMDRGIILTTGKAKHATTVNTSPIIYEDNQLNGDADLTKIVGFGTYDASVLEFDFESDGSDLEFRFVFASEEYPGYVDRTYNDVFGFFTGGEDDNGDGRYFGGTNIAVLPIAGIYFCDPNHYARNEFLIGQDGWVLFSEEDSIADGLTISPDGKLQIAPGSMDDTSGFKNLPNADYEWVRFAINFTDTGSPFSCGLTHDKDILAKPIEIRFNPESQYYGQIEVYDASDYSIVNNPHGEIFYYSTSTEYRIEFEVNYEANEWTLLINNRIIRENIKFRDNVNLSSNDIQGFWMIGKEGTLNAAIDNIQYSTTRLPYNANIAVAINTVNKPRLSEGNKGIRRYYRENHYSDELLSSYPFEYNGFTTVLTAFLTGLEKGTTCHLKLAISDTWDRVYDAAVFLEANSFKPVPVVVRDMQEFEVDGQDILFSGAEDGQLFDLRTEKDDGAITDFTFGKRDFVDLGDIRAFEVFEGELYVGAGNTLYRPEIDFDNDNVTVNFDASPIGTPDANNNILSLLGAHSRLLIGTGADASTLPSSKEGKIFEGLSTGGQLSVEDISDGLSGSGIQYLYESIGKVWAERVTLDISAEVEQDGGFASFQEVHTIIPIDFLANEVQYSIEYGSGGLSGDDADDMCLVAPLPPGTTFVTAFDTDSDNWVYDVQGRRVIWFDIQNGHSYTLRLMLDEKTCLPRQTLAMRCWVENDIYVKSTFNDEVKVGCWGGDVVYVNRATTGSRRNGLSWETAYSDLQQAIDFAGDCGKSEIWVAQGTYSVGHTLVLDSIGLYGGFTGRERFRDQRNAASNATILRASGVDYAVTLEHSSRIDGFTIRSATQAGILCSDGSPTITHCRIQGNGHGLLCNGICSPIIINCIIANNTQEGIHISGESSPRMRNNTIADNSGFGIKNEGNGSPEMYNCILWGNSLGQTTHTTYLFHCYIEGSAYTKDNKDTHNNFGGDYPFDGNSYNLTFESPCKDEGTSSSLPDGLGIQAQETGISGKARIMGGAVDIGAYEFPPFSVYAGDFKRVNFSPVDFEGASDTKARILMSDASILSNGIVDLSGLTYEWSMISGPAGGDVAFINQTGMKLNAIVEFSKMGRYWLKLTVEANGITVSDTVPVQVEAGVEIVPYLSDLNSPVTRVYVNQPLNLTAKYAVPYGLGELVWEWSAPYETANLANPNVLNGAISFDMPGFYQIGLYAKNSDDMVIGVDDEWIEVVSPDVTVSAGPEQVIYLVKEDSGHWQAGAQFTGSVSGMTATRYEWSVQAANDYAHVSTVSFSNTTSLSTRAVFGDYGAYFVLFSAWANTPYGELFLGTGAATVIVTYQQVELYAGGNLSVGDENMPAPVTANLAGQIKQGFVDRVQWVCDGVPEGMVTFTSPNSLRTSVIFSQVDNYSGGGEYLIALLGFIGDEIVAVDTLVAYVTVGNGEFTTIRTLTLDPFIKNMPQDIGMPLVFSVGANLWLDDDTPFTAYTSAVWSWSGMDNSLMIRQGNTNCPDAEITVLREGSYTLNLVVKNNQTQVGVANLEFTVTKDQVEICAGEDATFDEDDVTMPFEFDLHGTVKRGMVDRVEWVWDYPLSDRPDLVFISNADTLNPRVKIEPVTHNDVNYSGAGTYRFALLGKRGDQVVAVDTVTITVNDENGTGDSITQILTIEPFSSSQNDSLPFEFSLGANMKLNGIDFNDYTSARWSWSGADGSVEIIQEDTAEPNASVLIHKEGSYVLILVVRDDQGLVGTANIELEIIKEQIEVDAGPDRVVYPTEIAPDTPYELTLSGSVKQGHVDAVKWVWDHPSPRPDLIEIEHDASFEPTIKIKPAIHDDVNYSGAGTYRFTLLGKKGDRIVAVDTMQLTVVYNAPGEIVQRTLTIEPIACSQNDSLPFEFSLGANITLDGIDYDDYIFAQWSWSGTDGSVNIVQSDTSKPEAQATIHKEGRYVLNLVVKNGQELIGTANIELVIAGHEQIVFDTGDDITINWPGKTRLDEPVEVALYGKVVSGNTAGLDIQWILNADITDGPDLAVVTSGLPAGNLIAGAITIQATGTYSGAGTYPVALVAIDPLTGELLACETINVTINLNEGSPATIFEREFTVSPKTNCPAGRINLTSPVRFDVWADIQDQNGNAFEDYDDFKWSWSGLGEALVIGDKPSVSEQAAKSVTISKAGNYYLTLTLYKNSKTISSAGIQFAITEESVKATAGFDEAVSNKVIDMAPLEQEISLYGKIENRSTLDIRHYWQCNGPAGSYSLRLCNLNDLTSEAAVKFHRPGVYALTFSAAEKSTGDLLSSDTIIANVGQQGYTIGVDPFTMPTLVNGHASVEITARILGNSHGCDTDIEWTAEDVNVTFNPSHGRVNSGSQVAVTFSQEGVYHLRVTGPANCSNSQTLTIPVYVGQESTHSTVWHAGNYKTTFVGVPIHISDASFISSDTSIVPKWSVLEKPDADAVVTFLPNLMTGKPYSTFSHPGRYILQLEPWNSAENITALEGNNIASEVIVDVRQDQIGPILPPTGQPVRYHDTSSSGTTADKPHAILVNFKDINSESTIGLKRADDAKAWMSGGTGNNAGVFEDNNLPIPVIRFAQGTLYAHVGFANSETKYKVEICVKGDDGWLRPVRVITPQSDPSGWAITESDGSQEEELGNIDLSILKNGVYYILLRAEANGVSVYDTKQVILDCPLKIGQVQFSQEDLAIDTGGIPLQVIRTYDSFNKDKDGEFGYGWSYSISNMDIELDEERITMHANSLFNYGSTWTESVRYGDNLENRNVTLTLPNGRRTTFMFYLKYHGFNSNNATLPYYTAEYASMPGVAATLRTLDREVCQIDLIRKDITWMGVTGHSNQLVANDPAMYDFSGFVLTTEDGTQYIFERQRISDYEGGLYSYGRHDVTSYWTKIYGKPCLSRIVLSTGERIELNPNLPNGQMQDIEYKDRLGNTVKRLEVGYGDNGRISYINAPSENGEGINGKPTVKYEYDDFGNLEKVHRLVNKDTVKYETTLYFYGKDPSTHYITDIKDSRGITPIRYEYDAAGRMIATVDAKGNRIDISHEAAAKAEVVYERWDTEKRYPTYYVYNSRGNVVSVQKRDCVDPENHIILDQTDYEYDTQEFGLDKPVLIKQAIGYDGTETVWAVSHNQYFYYDNPNDKEHYGKLIRHIAIDPGHNVTDTEYNLCGNITVLSQGRNAVLDGDTWGYISILTTRNFYTSDNLLYLTGTATGTPGALAWHSISVTLYDIKKRISKTIHVDVNLNIAEQLFTDSAAGKVKSHEELAMIDNWSGCTVTTHFYYDNTEDTGYGQMYRIQESSGRKQYFHYDINGNQVASWYIWVNPDTEQNVRILTVNETDAQGRSIRSIRIADNGLIPIAEVLDNVQSHLEEGPVIEYVITDRTVYNSVGKVDYAIDANMNLTKYEYDETGNTTEVRTYNVAGIDESNYPDHLADPANVLTVSRTLFDTEGRVLVTVGPYAPAVYSGHPSLWPTATENVYDALGRIERIRRWKGSVIELIHLTKPGQSDVIIGKTTGVTPGNAWEGTGNRPLTIGWKVWDADAQRLTVPAVGNETSYTRTVYNFAGRVEYTVTLDEQKQEHAAGYEYDIAGRQTAAINPLGFDVTYDASGLIIIGLDKNGTHRTETHYDGSRRDYVVDAQGNKTEFFYDALGRVITTVHPATLVEGAGVNPVATYSHVGYDGLGRKVWETEPTTSNYAYVSNNLDTLAKQFVYDPAGRLLMVILPVVDDGANSLVHPIYRYYYDAYGNQTATLDPLGRATVFEYDHMGRQKKKYMPFKVEFGPGVDLADPTVYSGLDDTIRAGLTNASPASEEKGYDQDGRLEWEKDYKGQFTVYAYYDQTNFRDGGALYGLPGQLMQLDYWDGDPEGSGQLKSSLSYVYDAYGRKKTETTWEDDGSPEGLTRDWRYGYDAEGNIEEIEAPQGIVKYDYNEVTGRKFQVRKGYAEIVAQYGYDDLGRLETVRAMMRNGVPISNEITTYGYNAVGSREWMLLPNDVYTRYTYNAMHRLTDVVHYTQIPQENPPLPPTLSSFNYPLNANGMRGGVTETVKVGLQQTDETRTIQYGYDNLNRLITETATAATDGYSISYVYNLVGNRTQRVVTANGQTLTTIYNYDDDTDRLMTEVHTAPIAGVPYGDGQRIYAYADGSGGMVWQLPGSNRRIGQFGAFVRGLPSMWSRVTFYTLMFLIPVVMLWPVAVRQWSRLRGGFDPLASLDLKLWHRVLCVLLAYIFLVGPEGFHRLAQAETHYSQLSTLAWGKGNTIIVYGYDANGSLTSKTTTDTATSYVTETVVYTYNLQNRLTTVTTTPYSGGVAQSPTVTEYRYNPQGIRVGKIVDDAIYTDYLIDPYNHTGYAQVLEETTDDGTTLMRIQYTIGDDMISQTTSTYSGGIWTAGGTKYLFYDGHGSTRQLAGSNQSIQQSYSYDAYGVMLGSAANPADSAQTNYLYAGEQYDSSVKQYYSRARYYNPSNGLFNRVDPYSGNLHDPQSLHKYLYCHNNPVNSVDPTGLMEFSLTGMMQVAFLGGLITANVAGWTVAVKGGTSQQILDAQVKWFWIGFISTTLVYTVSWTAHSIWLWIYGGSQVASNTQVQTELHHFASNKHSTWTPRFEQIAGRFKLSLNDAWNLNPFSTRYHSGPHPEAYHQWVFERMTQAANQAGQSANQFIILYQKYVVLPVMENPEMLKAEYWKGG